MLDYKEVHYDEYERIEKKKVQAAIRHLSMPHAPESQATMEARLKGGTSMMNAKDVKRNGARERFGI